MAEHSDPGGGTRRWPLIGGWAAGVAGTALSWPGVGLLAMEAFVAALRWLVLCFALGALALMLGAVARADARRSPVGRWGATTAIYILGALDVAVALGCAWYSRSNCSPSSCRLDRQAGQRKAAITVAAGSRSSAPVGQSGQPHHDLLRSGLRAAAA